MPADPDIELVRTLARTIRAQADGAKEYERMWIAGAAALIDRLASGDATDADRVRARSYLERAR